VKWIAALHDAALAAVSVPACAIARAARRLSLRARLGHTERQIQLLDTHAARMRGERAALCEERGRIALELLGMGES